MSVKRASRSILLIALPLSLGASASGLFDVNDPATSPQVWDLTNSAGQVASVMVSPFTNSGTFGEVEGSAGWLEYRQRYLDCAETVAVSVSVD